MEIVDISAMGFFPLTVLGSFLEGSSVQVAVGSILAEFSESKKTSGDRAATLLYRSLLFSFWGEIAASGKGRRNPSFPLRDVFDLHAVISA